MLRKTLVLIGLISILGIEMYAQRGLRSINWKDDQLMLHAKTYGRKPIFSEQIPFHFTEGNVKIDLINTTYEEVDEEDVKFLTAFVIDSSISVSSEIKTISNESFLFYGFMPLRMNPKTLKIEKLKAFDLSIEIIPGNSLMKALQFKNQSVLASGRWFKIRVAKDGIYKISYTDLQAMGMNMNGINPQNIRIYGNGGGMLPENNSDTKFDDLIENAIEVIGETDAIFNETDYVLFYGQSPHVWNFDESTQKYLHISHAYSDYTYYFITADLGKGKRIQQQHSLTETPNKIISEFEDHQFHEQDEFNLINSGRNWYGEVFDATTNRTFNFNFPNLVQSKELHLNIRAALRSSVSSKFDVSFNGSLLNQLSASGINFSSSYPPFANTGKLSADFLSNNESIAIELKYNKPNPTSKAWLDNIELTAWRQLKLEGEQMGFRNSASVADGAISVFKLKGTSNSTSVWNVTNPMNVTKLDGNLIESEFNFVLATDSLLEFVAFSEGNLLRPEFVEEISNQNYHALPSVDFIIVSPNEFYDQALRLGEYHRNRDGLSYCIVEPKKIYNEFSSGAQDISAIRNFVRMLYLRAEPVIPKYLLLFGDASFDFKDRITGNTNFVPTWESPFSTAIIVSYNTDDYFGLLDENEGANIRGGLDIGIGRIPVKTVDEARQMVDKIIHYSENSRAVLGAWRNTVCLVGDDQDYNTYVRDSEQIGAFIDGGFKNINIDKVYFDAYPQISTPGGQRYPDAKKAINEKVGKGALVVNYIGHGGETGWAHERVLETQDIKAWQNYDRLPVLLLPRVSLLALTTPNLNRRGNWFC